MLLIFFKKLTRPKFVAYRVLLIKDTECTEKYRGDQCAGIIGVMTRKPLVVYIC